MRKRKVLWVIKGLGPGGAERLLVDAAPHVDTDRFSYEAVYLLPWKDQLATELADAGIPVRCLDVARVWNPSWMVRLRTRLRGDEIDVVHAHLPTSSIGARLAARSLGARRPKIVYTEHNVWSRYRWETRMINRATFGLDDAAIAVSDAVATSMSPSARRRTTVIANGIDAAALRAQALSRMDARAQLGLPPDGLLVGTIGGITPKKGHVDLVRAAAEVVRRVPDATFVFLGLPIEAEPVEREIAAHGLGDRVKISGYVAGAARFLPAFDVMCLPSLSEGMPLSVMEAMTLGVPVVATRAGGTPELIEHGRTGLLVAPSHPPALAAALEELLGDAARRAALGKAGANEAGRFDIVRMVRAVESRYLALLGDT